MSFSLWKARQDYNVLMKRYLILLLFISFCGGNVEVSNESSAVENSSTTTSIFSSTTTTLQESDTPFNTYWRDNMLKSYPQLTEAEIELSNTINQDKISYLKLADGTECTKRVGGTVTNARIDENYPLYAEATDYWKFILLESYTCDDEKRPGRLYGEIFYQDDNWWTYVEINSDEIDIDSEWDVGDLNVWKFATRTAIADDTFSGNYACKADADYIEQAYEKKELDNYYFYRDKEIDYLTPNNLEEHEESIALLEKAQKYYTSALAVRLGYNFGDVEDLDPDNSYIDAVLYGLIVNTEDNLASKYAMRDYIIENGPFETNADVTAWWESNSKYSAVNWRKTDEAVEFDQGKVEPFEGVGNHIVNPDDLPNPDWVVSDEYPRNILRSKCSN
jgi:hypothetical protein